MRQYKGIFTVTASPTVRVMLLWEISRHLIYEFGIAPSYALHTAMPEPRAETQAIVLCLHFSAYIHFYWSPVITIDQVFFILWEHTEKHSLVVTDCSLVVIRNKHWLYRTQCKALPNMPCSRSSESTVYLSRGSVSTADCMADIRFHFTIQTVIKEVQTWLHFHVCVEKGGFFSLDILLKHTV